MKGVTAFTPMKTGRVPTRDVRENRFEREEKMGKPLESLPGKTLRDRRMKPKSVFGGQAPSQEGFMMAPAIRNLPATQANQDPLSASVEFRLIAPQASKVFLAGVFNNWDPESLPLAKKSDGAWSHTMRLPRGSYEYRFVVDGIWQEDPLAFDSAPNPYGSRNSLKRVSL